MRNLTIALFLAFATTSFAKVNSTCTLTYAASSFSGKAEGVDKFEAEDKAKSSALRKCIDYWGNTSACSGEGVKINCHSSIHTNSESNQTKYSGILFVLDLKGRVIDEFRGSGLTEKRAQDAAYFKCLRYYDIYQCSTYAIWEFPVL